MVQVSRSRQANQLANAKLPLGYRLDEAFDISIAIAKMVGLFAGGAVGFATLTYFGFKDGGEGLFIAVPSAAVMLWVFAMLPAALSEARHSLKSNPAEEANKRGKGKLNWGMPLPATAYVAASPLASGGAYFGSLRTVVMLTAGLYAAAAYSRKRPFSAALLACVAILFNPILPVYLGTREAWLPIDIAAVVAIWYAAVRLRDVVDQAV